MAVRVANSLCDEKCRKRDAAYYQQYDIDVSRILPPVPNNKPLNEYSLDDWKAIQEHVASIDASLTRKDASVDICEVFHDAMVEAGGKEIAGEELLQLIDKHRDETNDPKREASPRYEKLNLFIELQKAIIPIRNAVMIDTDDEEVNDDDMTKFWYANCGWCRQRVSDAYPSLVSHINHSVSSTYSPQAKL